MRAGHAKWGHASGHASGHVLLLAILLSSAAPALAKVQMTVDVGWSNRYRAGRWTPLYVTLTDSQPRDVTIDVYSPTDRRYALRAVQRLTIGPSPKTVALYVPLSYRIDEASVVVHDTDSRKRLADLIVADNPSYPGSRLGGSAPEAIEQNALFVGVSGDPVGQRIVEGQLSQNSSSSTASVRTCAIPQSRLPAVAVGYDAIDLLVLNRPDLSTSAKLSAEQQQALADWVRGGGNLVIWPGSDPIPTDGPLADILPCSVGASRDYVGDAAAISRAGLPARFGKLRGRALINPTSDSKSVRLLGGTEPWGYRRWAGYGQVLMVGPDLSQLVFSKQDDGTEFWRGALGGVVSWPEVDPNNPGNYYWNYESRRAVPTQKTMNWIGNIPGAGSFGFGYVAGTLLALMCIVGPVDWFVLKWTGKQPWTWVTITGWIAVVTLGAIYVGHVFKAGELYFRTASVIDEAAGSRVGSLDLIGIYSPRTTEYKLETDPQGWWRAASDGQYFGGGGNMETEIACHQDYRGNTPFPMTINVWNLRFLENAQYGSAPPIIDTKIVANGDSVAGRISNRGTVPLTGVQVRTRKGVAKIHEAIAPGASITIDAKLSTRDASLATMPLQEQQRRWQRYDPDDEGPATRPSTPLLSGLADARAVQIDQILRDRGDVACVYASYDVDPTERVKLQSEEEAKRSHIGLVRALVPLE